LHAARNFGHIEIAAHARVLQALPLHNTARIVHDLVQPALALLAAHTNALAIRQEAVRTEAALHARLRARLVLHAVGDVLAGGRAQAAARQVLLRAPPCNVQETHLL